MGQMAVEGIVGMRVGKREGFTPEEPRSLQTTAPSSLGAWALTHCGRSRSRAWRWRPFHQSTPGRGGVVS